MEFKSQDAQQREQEETNEMTKFPAGRNYPAGNCGHPDITILLNFKILQKLNQSLFSITAQTAS